MHENIVDHNGYCIVLFRKDDDQPPPNPKSQIQSNYHPLCVETCGARTNYDELGRNGRRVQKGCNSFFGRGHLCEGNC